MIPFRGQKKVGLRPDWSPLGAQLKISKEHPHPFHMQSSPPAVNRQLNYKNITIDLVLIHQIHHTFKNAVLMQSVPFEVLAEQAIRLKSHFFYLYTLPFHSNFQFKNSLHPGNRQMLLSPWTPGTCDGEMPSELISEHCLFSFHGQISNSF